jgi:hypothetical protein
VTNRKLPSAYVNCRDGDLRYREFKARGAEITREPEVTF